MKSHYRVVVIGGGVVGASIAYHLTKFGWPDVAILERSVLTAGSSWHAAGGYHALNADPNIASLQAYTIDVLSSLEQETGQATGLHMTGGITFACTPDRWEWLQSAYRVFQTMGIEDVRLMTPDQIYEACPIISTDGIYGGMWADREGYVDTTGVVQAYAKGARRRGAEVIEHNRVVELKRRGDGWEVVTEKGTIVAEHVVNAAGLWAKQVGRMVGLDLPLSPLEHHYLVTESVPELAALDFEVPMMVDLDGFTYARQDQKGMLVGIYETNHQHWNMDGAPVGLRLRADPAESRSHRERALHRVLALSAARARRHQALGERRLHLHARRQPAGRSGARPARLLACLRGDGGLPAGRRRRQVARRVDDQWRTGLRHLRNGRRPLRRFRIQSRIHPPDDGPVLFPPFRDDLSERAALGRPSLEEVARLRRDGKERCALGRELGAGGADLFRALGFHRSAHAEALQRLRHHRRGMPQDARRPSASSTPAASRASK